MSAATETQRLLFGPAVIARSTAASAAVPASSSALADILAGSDADWELVGDATEATEATIEPDTREIVSKNSRLPLGHLVPHVSATVSTSLRSAAAAMLADLALPSTTSAGTESEKLIDHDGSKLWVASRSILVIANYGDYSQIDPLVNTDEPLFGFYLGRAAALNGIRLSIDDEAADVPVELTAMQPLSPSTPAFRIITPSWS